MVKKRCSWIIIIAIIIELLVFAFYAMTSVLSTYNPFNMKIKDKYDYLIINDEKYVACFDNFHFVKDKEKVYEKSSIGYFFIIYTDSTNDNVYLLDGTDRCLMYIKDGESINNLQIDYYVLTLQNGSIEKYIIKNGNRIAYYNNDVCDDISLYEITSIASGEESKKENYDLSKYYCQCDIYLKNNIVLELYVFKKEGEYFCYSIPFIESDKQKLVKVKKISNILFE